MDASLSVEEFQRMQEQLIDLRTKNYSIGEKNVKLQTELLHSTKLLEDTQKELFKCQKILSRSKSAKEIELLIQENESIQKKLQIQEDEFRLQNETLMQEVSVLISSNKNTVKELELLKSQCEILPSSHEGDSIIKLEAENKALKNVIANLTRTVDNSDNVNIFEVSNQNLDSQLKFKILEEEKMILQQSMKKLETEHKEELLIKQEEIQNLSDRLKRKQESFLQVQAEREKLYSDNKSKFNDLEKSKAAEIQQLKDQIKIVQLDLRRALELNENFGGDEKRDPTVELSADKAVFECSWNETKQSVVTKLQTLSSQISQLEKKNQACEKHNKELKLKNDDFEKMQIELEESLQEKVKLAEQRKKLIDDMNDHLLEMTNKHSAEIEHLTKKLAEEQEAFKKIFDKEKETKLKLIEAKKEIQILKAEIEKLEIDCSASNEKAVDFEERLNAEVSNCNEMIKNKDAAHDEHVQSLLTTYSTEKEDLIIQIELARAQKVEFEDKVMQLQQDAKDSIDERKIQEKKGMSMVKDLKRQLQMERNRAEKLQERLQEILSQQSQTVDDILMSSTTFEKPKGDTSSISSWSYVSGGTAERENADPAVHSDTSSGGHESSSSSLENETSNLLNKIANLQQKSWTLEEKVNHLELSNGALVDDVLKKTAIIQFYCMEGRSDSHSSNAQDKLTIKRVVDFIKDRGDENLKEMNRRMQRMLEETLTKNMHLQKDIETLSNEVSRLSKIAPAIENRVHNTPYVENIKN